MRTSCWPFTPPAWLIISTLSSAAFFLYSPSQDRYPVREKIPPILMGSFDHAGPAATRATKTMRTKTEKTNLFIPYPLEVLVYEMTNCKSGASTENLVISVS